MADPRALKVSYCTTCKGRLHHLRETLPKNMAAEKDNPNVEFVLLSYGKDPDMDAWVKENFQKEMDTGRLKYVVYPDAEHFKMAHAKNMAHRMATGDILVNVDADNFIAKDTSIWLKETYAKDPHALVTHLSVSLASYLNTKFQHHIVNRFFGGEPSGSNSWGHGGRLAISAEDYYKVNGYSEEYNAWGSDDWDLAIRACQQTKASYIKHPQHLKGDVIDHSHEERFVNMTTEDKAISAERLHMNAANKTSALAGLSRKAGNFRKQLQFINETKPVANVDGNFGTGTVYINFSDQPTVIAPLGEEKKRAIGNMIYSLQKEPPEQRRDWAVRLKNPKDRGGFELH